MATESWIALSALAFTVLLSSGGLVAILFSHKNEILNKMAEDKESTDQELMAIRMSAYEEYKTLRKEIGDVASISRKEFGDTIHSIREKVTQVELWVRDQLTDTRHTLTGSMDMRHNIVVEKMEKTDDRVRVLELHAAQKG